MRYLILGFIMLGIIGCSHYSHNPNDVLIENEEIRLIISSNGIAKSLWHKPTKTECLMQGQNVPVFSVTQYYITSHETRFAHPFEETEFVVDSVYRKGDQLIVGFALNKLSGQVNVEAIVDLNITSQYIHFSIKDFIFSGKEIVEYKAVHEKNLKSPEIDEMWFLQLPIRDRTHFGEWLNVIWDDQLAVNILGTDLNTRIDSEERNGYRILKAGMVSDVKSKGVGAALITASTTKLLDIIDRIEEDFNLPKGVKSRRNEKYSLSYGYSYRY